jgi:hypothetical protein
MVDDVVQLWARLVRCIWPNLARGMQVLQDWLPASGVGPGPTCANGPAEPGCRET